MEKETSYSTITKQKIASSKGLQLICAFLTLILDAAVLVLLYHNTSEIKFFICPGLLLLLDLVFVIKALFSNYRFAYAIKGVYIHIAAVVLVCAYMIVSAEILDSRIVFATVALYAMPVVHLLQCAASLINAFHARDKKNVGRSVTAIALSSLLAASIGLYGFFIFQSGIFGQSRERTVVYSFDEQNGYYVASGVLNGFGGTVIIPETFDGLPVGAIDCSLFSAKRLARVVFDCDPGIVFKNPERIGSSVTSLKLETTKQNLDTLRLRMYALSDQNAEFIHMANNTVPYDMEDGQVYVLFCYDKASLSTVGNRIIPTWFGNENEKLDVRSHAAGIDYIEFSNSNEISHLYWCEKNQSSKIFRSVLDEKGEGFNDTNVSKSGKLNVTFEQIYRINIGEDNDTVYTLDAVHTSIQTQDGVKNYKLATASGIMSVLEQLPLRNGFDRSFKVGSDKHDLTDIEAEIALMDQSGITQINVYPNWQLRAPTISSIAADGKSFGHSAVYGSNVQLTSEASAPHESLSLKYEWKKTGVVASSAAHTISNLHPSDAGEYELTVTAYADFTSLTSTAVKTVNVGFEKKDLRFTWMLPEDKVYSASNKEFTVTPAQSDVINGDTITQNVVIRLGGSPVANVRNAGEYTLNIELTGDAATKYKIYFSNSENDGVRMFNIEPYSVQVIWGQTASFVYNGGAVGPSASTVGLYGEAVPVTVEGKATNVGQYTALATTSNGNYRLLGTSMNFSVTPKPISAVVWDGNTSFVYNSETQHPKVQNLEGLVAADKTRVLNSIVYDGTQINAGSGYTVSVSLSNSLPASNYVLECDTTKAYSINRKPMTITVGNLSKEYTGVAPNPSQYSFTHSDIAKNDKIEEILAFTYKTYVGGVETPAVNVVAAGYTIGGDMISKEKYGNYEITLVSGTLTITPKALTVQLNDQEKTYDGMIFGGEYTFDSIGLVKTDRIEDVVRTMTFTEVTDKDAGRYDIRAQISTAGRGEKYGNYTITIVPGTLTIKKAPITVVAVGATKVYDGYSFASDAFGIAVDGNLYEGITPAELGMPIFSGKATMEKNVGTHALSVSLGANNVNSNYEITYAAGESVITPKPITVTAKDASKIYNGQKGGVFDFEVDADQLAYGDTKSTLGTVVYGGTASTAKNVGTYTVTVTSLGTGNYIIAESNPGTFTITKKSVTVTPVATTRTYDGTVGGAFSVTVSGLVSGENASILGTPVFSGNATTAKNAGTYTLNVEYQTEAQNYTVAQYNSGSFVIRKARFTVNVTTLSKEYDGKAVDTGSLNYTVSGLCAGDTASMLGTPQYSGSLVMNNLGTAGSYTLTLSMPGNENYEEGSAIFTYTITPKEITVTAIAADRVYDGTAGGKFSITANGLIEGEDVSVLGTPVFYGDGATAINAGTYTLKVQFNSSTGNYKVTQCNSASFTITPKEVTVTAVAVNRAYAEGMIGGDFSFRIDGLVSGSEKDFNAVYGGSALKATEKGTYELTVTITSKSNNNNYTFKYVPASFTIS